MGQIRGLSIFLVVCTLLLGHLNAQETNTEETGSITVSNDTNSILAPTINVTTTTTTAPITIGHSSTTEKPKTTTTTIPSTTTTTTPATTTSAPAPWPKNENTWNVTEAGVTCIKLKGAFELVVPYNGSDKKTNSTTIMNGTLSVPVNAVATGECGISKNATKQTITLTWDGSNITYPNELNFIFEVNNNKSDVDHVSSGKWALVKISMNLSVDPEIFVQSLEKNSSLHFEIDDLAKYQVPVNHSYKCMTKETVKNDKGNGPEIKVADLQVEAFRIAQNETMFNTAQECALDGVTDVVPIAVGASLAGLVVIVLIAYLIGRRRSRARGYQSV